MISVLYVDDEPGLLEIGKLFLERSGQFSVDILTSAPAALTLLNTKKYDAIISDYQMPEMDGIEFLKKVRTSGNTIPFILFTGRGREEVVIQALNEGADFYLQKGGNPVPQFTELAHKIRQAVQQRRAEISIRDHERREADIISFLPDPTVAIDTHGVVIAWNRMAEKMTGIRASEILGKGNYEYALPFYHERRPALIDLVLHDDPDLKGKYPLLKRDGRTLIAEATLPHLYNGRGATIWFTATPLYDSTGAITGAIESVRDITDRKQAEMELSRKHEELEAAYNQLSAQENELKQRMNDIITSQSALRESQEKYRNLIENAGETIFIVQGEYLKFVNQRATEVTGYTREELLSRPFLEFVHPGDRAMITANYQYWMRGEHLGVYTFRIVRGNGEVRIVEIRAAPILWGGAPATLNFIMDVTRQKQAEIALRESEEKYRVIVESSFDGIAIYQDGMLVYMNQTAARLLGAEDPAVFHGMPVINFAAPAFRERIAKRIQCAPDMPLELLREQFLRADGSTIDVDVTTTPGFWKGRPAGFVTFRDITKQMRAEDEINFKNILLLTQQETSLDGILVVDENGTIINFNKKLIEIWGIPEDLIESRIDGPLLQFVTGQFVDPERYLSRIRYLYNHKDVKSFEEIHLKDGRILERFSAPMLGEREKYYGRVWYFRDVTEQKTLENTLTTSQISLTEAMELAHMVNWEFDGQTGMFTFNDRFYALYGTTAEREGGYQMPAVVYIREFVHPDDRDRITTVVKRGIEMSGPHDVSELEHRIIRRDGEIRFIIVRVQRITDKDNHSIKINGVNQDITRRKRAEEENWKARQILEGILNSIQVRVFWKDRNLTYLGCNTQFARDAGFEKPEDVIGRDDFAMGWRDQAELYRSDDRIVIESGMPKMFIEEPQKTPSGDIISLLTTKIPLRGAGGNVIGVLGTYIDITERKRAEKALEQARKKLSLLNYVTFNDIQTMIFSLSAYKQLEKNPVTNMPMGNIIKKEEDILQKITHSLNFAKSYQDLGLKPPRWQNVNQVFLLAISHLDFLNMKHQVMPGNLEIFADPLLEQVFQILADNTLTHGKTATQVVVRYAEGPEFLTLIFEDNGVGIPRDTKDKIFSPDFQKTRAIGLFLAWEILEITGITLRETGEPGRGARFEMTVPKEAWRLGTG